MGLAESGLKRRARRALERQLDYQRRKAARYREREVAAYALSHSRAVRARIEAVRPIATRARVLEVGCGAHGLIFYFGARDGIGVDPLAHHYRQLWPDWQHRTRTVAAFGEALPFADASFDLVLCDNVVDHAESPRRILNEIARVLAPGATLYFDVNVHHPVYSVAAAVHAGWRALGVPFEIGPFADHTVHLTRAKARGLFDGLPLRILDERDDIAEVKRRPPRGIRHAGDRLKRLFFKNASYEVVAEKERDALPLRSGAEAA
ncbi:MAG: class I SAM-dependent methyltransferase [Pseudomonadota bacterium]|nr:class I SAM-dependent methyltransferase [Pseudomonadota bacterium]